MNSRSEPFDKIADGLAKDGYAVVDRFLSSKEVTRIIELDEFGNGLTRLKRAGTGKQLERKINEGIRGDYIQWIDEAAASGDIKNYLGRLRELATFLNRNLMLSLKDVEAHLTNYPAGSFYQRHLDQFKGDDHRKLSVICYLNKEWKSEQGGQLRMHLHDGPVDIYPNEGKLVCFRSDQIEHEVLSATRDRLSITAWILDQFAELRHL